jgi:hypothetical protein
MPLTSLGRSIELLIIIVTCITKTKVLEPIGTIGLDKIRNCNVFVFVEEGEQRKGYGDEAVE